MPTFSVLLFDLDHTLFDSDASEALALVATLRGAGVVDGERHLPTYSRINRALWDRVERGELTPHDVKLARFRALVDEAGLAVAGGGADALAGALADAYADALGEHGDLYAGALDVLAYVKARARTALVTNGLSEVQRRRLARLGLARFFDAIVISAEVGASKPAKAIFEIAFAQLQNPDKSQVLMVGDSLSSDMRGGRDFGVSTCWYNPKRKPRPAGAPCDHEIVDLQELKAFVTG